jgi:hypothetical protein
MGVCGGRLKLVYNFERDYFFLRQMGGKIWARREDLGWEGRFGLNKFFYFYWINKILITLKIRLKYFQLIYLFE